MFLAESYEGRIKKERKDMAHGSRQQEQEAERGHLNHERKQKDGRKRNHTIKPQIFSSNDMLLSA